MAFGTMEKIQTVTVGAGGINSIDFTSIPSTYTDLVVLVSFRSTRSNDEDGSFMTINSSTTGYSWRMLQSNGSAASSSTGTDRFIGQITASTTTASTFTNFSIYIPNYAGSTNKSYSVDNVTEANATKAYGQLIAGLWSNTAVITSLSFQSDSLGIGSKLAEFSTATLYGITRVPAGAKATGGVIYDDSSYWYHVFTSSGTFTPNASMSCDVLVVAGGGGGGGTYLGGGGGAGGLRLLASQTVSSATTVTIGAGGTAGTALTQTKGGTGVNSSFGSIATSGGGGGGSYGTAINGANGGSGGGGSGDGVSTGGTGNAGSYSPVEGYAGGSSPSSLPNYGCGGGGGAGGVGSAGTSTVGGNGGVGTDTYNSINFSSWLTTTSTGSSSKLAGGGGGAVYASTGAGTGGSGGGGNGGNTTDGQGVAGVTNTGSGGGGSERGGGTKAGGAGGSGIVIVRYAK